MPEERAKRRMNVSCAFFRVAKYPSGVYNNV